MPFELFAQAQMNRDAADCFVALVLPGFDEITAL